MKKRLIEPLTIYDKSIEFQIDRMLVWVKCSDDRERVRHIDLAEKILPELETDIEKVVKIATKSVDSKELATVVGILTEPDGCATYDCTFFSGEHEDCFVYVSRSADGVLSVKDG